MVVGDHAQVHRQWVMDALLRLIDPSRLAVGTCVEAKEDPQLGKPLLMVDVDGVLSLFGFPPQAPPEGSLHFVDGIPHLLSSTAARHLLSLVSLFELVWCSGWEERADEHLPHLLGLPRGLPHLSFERGGSTGKSIDGHWKLAAVDAHAGARPLAWIDDCIDDACHAWARRRRAPTLLVRTSPEVGLTVREASRLRAWALALGEGMLSTE
jgi:HAD domain in Swiss Army Knife RNA repair proteins